MISMSVKFHTKWCLFKIDSFFMHNTLVSISLYVEKPVSFLTKLQNVLQLHLLLQRDLKFIVFAYDQRPPNNHMKLCNMQE